MGYLEIAVVAVSFLVLLLLLFSGRVPAPVAFFISVSLLVIFNVLTPKEALSGFSNEQIAVIVLLLVASYAVEKTRILPVIFSKIIPFNISFKSFIVRLTLLVTTFSSFLNNTPIVAMLIPYVTEWARRRNAPLSKILIPLSYAAILGGTVTLIGTSTNLLVAFTNTIRVSNWDFSTLPPSVCRRRLSGWFISLR